MSRALLQLAHGSQQAVAWMILCSIPVSTVYIFSLGNQSSSRQPIVWNNTWHGTRYAALTRYAYKLSLV